MDRYRVGQWSTGGVGALAVAAIARRPDLDLVGVWVHSTDKGGQDAGDLCGLPPTGVITTNDSAEVLGLDPDCVCYTATADLRP